MIDYKKRKLNPEDYKIILGHCKEGWSFHSVSSKINMFTKHFYKAIENDKLVLDIRKTYCPNYRARVKK